MPKQLASSLGGGWQEEGAGPRGSSHPRVITSLKGSIRLHT